MNNLQVKLQKVALQIQKRVQKIHPEVKSVSFEARHASYGSSNAVILWGADNNIVDSHYSFTTDNPRVMADFMIRKLNASKKSLEV